MTKKKLTRGKLLVAAAPLAVAPIVGKLALGESAEAGSGHDHASHAESRTPTTHIHGAAQGHAAMIGEEAPAVGGPNDLDALLYPPRALPYERGRVREYTLVAVDKELEVAPGVFFPAWTYNGTAPGPVIRATEGDTLRVRFRNERLPPAHDPLPRDPPGEHGRGLRDRRARAVASPTSSKRARRASTSTTAMPRR